VAEALLRVEGLSKHFGGLVAVDRVSLDVAAGEVHAVIGPNGAGKTTLINLLSGDLAPSTGRVWLQGHDITGLSPHRIARRGVGRSYQRVNIFAELSALENCRIAAQARLKGGLPLWRNAESAVTLHQAARSALARVGLERAAARLARVLSHGEQRQLEIAMTLAIEPKLLLLDEPLAGMGAEESKGMVALIANLKRTHGVLLVEHDMGFVMNLADRIVVLDFGTKIAEGTPEVIKTNPEVIKAYLGVAA